MFVLNNQYFPDKIYIIIFRKGTQFFIMMTIQELIQNYSDININRNSPLYFKDSSFDFEDFCKHLKKFHSGKILQQGGIDSVKQPYYKITQVSKCLAYFLYKVKTSQLTSSLITKEDFFKIYKDKQPSSEADDSVFEWDNDTRIYINLPATTGTIPNLLDYFSKHNLLNDVIFYRSDPTEEIKGDNYMSNTKSPSINTVVSNAIKKHTAVIFTGAPGTGKTFTVREIVNERCSEDKTLYKFVQFHPSYDYTDFVEGLKPVQLKDSVEPTFVRLDGIFKKFCRDIVKANKPNETYYFIIDEINRADLSKVFGELMFCLEKDYRGSDNTVDTQYQYLKTYEIDPSDGTAHPIDEDGFKDGFYIPENLKIIGTMNDIDRSVDSIDFALRRRFRWIDIKANNIMRTSLSSILSGNTTPINEPELNVLTKHIIEMNNQLTLSSFGFTDAYHIGPAYFKDYKPTGTSSLNTDSLTSIFDENIEPIIREYTRGRDHTPVDDLIKKCRDTLLGTNT